MKKIWHGLVRYWKETDKILLCLCLVCSVYSIVLMCGIHHSDMATARAVKMQIVTSAMGLVAAVVISSFDYHFLSKLWKLYYPVCIGLVMLTYFFGEQRVESVDDQAWLPIPFLGISFQPSELLKIAFILTFALHLEKVGDDIKNIKNLLLLCLHGAFPVLLVHFQGDDGTALIFLLIFLSMLFFDRKVQKENVLLKVWNLCLLVIQIMVLLLFKEYQNHGLTFVFWDFFQEHPWLLWYLAGMNVLTFLVFAADKRKAVKKGPRIRIVVLLGLAFLGGSIGALLGMYLLHHKTKKNYFTVGVPLMLVMQVSILLGIMNL